MAYQEFLITRDDKYDLRFSVSECQTSVWFHITFGKNVGHDLRLSLTPEVATELGKSLLVKANVVKAAIEAGDDARAIAQAAAEAKANAAFEEAAIQLSTPGKAE